MDIFYTIVFSIAIILLILILTYIGIRISQKTGKLPFPPISSTCPDYWAVEGNTCVIPAYGKVNTGSLYTGKNALAITGTTTFGLDSNKFVIDFNNAGWNSLGKTTTCQQKDWADKYNITWDGVTNFSKC